VTTTDYLVDTSGHLSHRVAEMSGGNVNFTYVRAGKMLLGMLQGSPGGNARYFESEGIGSVRSLLDDNGNKTDVWRYTAFGEELSRSGTSTQPYAFAGEPFDKHSNLANHRARWLNPRAGIFVSADPARPRPTEPRTSSAYVYVWQNPQTHTDSTGGGLDPNVASTLATLSSVTALTAQRLGAARVNAFITGSGQAIGRALQAYGPAAERICGMALDKLQEFQPDILVEAGRELSGAAASAQNYLVGAGNHVLDYFVQLQNQALDIEVKWSIPTLDTLEGAQSMERLVGQVGSALSQGDSEVLLWSLRPITASQMRQLSGALGSQVAEVNIASGPIELFTFLTTYFNVF
jgi:RHS repeat-associated protein